MPEIGGYVATGVVTLVVGLILHGLLPKVKIVWWSPHSFTYQLDELDPPIALKTDSYTIQNVGRKKADFVEVAFRKKPDHIRLLPSLDYKEIHTPDGEYVIKTTSLGPREFFTLQILSYKSLPETLYIRSEAGHAQELPVRWVRWFPNWVYGIVWICMITGFGYLAFWVLQAAIFILRGIKLIE